MSSNFTEKKVFLLVLSAGRYSYKALHFDLRIHDLEQHYSSHNPKGAYGRIRQFLYAHNFTHEQYSGYHSNYKTTDLNVFNLVYILQETFPWFSACAKKFSVTDIGDNYDLTTLLNSDPAILS